MAKADVLLVAGDGGGAEALINLAAPLILKNLNLRFGADASKRARAANVFLKAGITFDLLKTSDDMKKVSEDLKKYVEEARVVVSTPCVTAYHTGAAVIRYGTEIGKTTIILGGLEFDHAYSPWRDLNPTFWIAHNEFHKRYILRWRPNLDSNKVIVMGNPIFANVPTLVANKEKNRQEVRNNLHIGEKEIFLLYWSPGEIRELCDENLGALVAGLKGLQDYCQRLGRRVVLGLRLHPKLDTTIYLGYRERWSECIKEICQNLGIRFVGGVDEIEPNCLNFGADIIAGERSTQLYLAALCGLVPIFIIPPLMREFFVEELRQVFPFISPLEYNLALGVYKKEDVGGAFIHALNPGLQFTLRANLSYLPSLEEVGNIADFITSQLGR